MRPYLLSYVMLTHLIFLTYFLDHTLYHYNVISCLSQYVKELDQCFNVYLFYVSRNI